MSKLKLMTIIGTRPEIIRLSATIKCCDQYFDQILVHTGQNYDYSLNQVFFEDLGLRAPDYYLNAVGKDLGETIGNIIAKSYQLMVEVRPDAVLVLGDTNSCLSVIGAKRLHIPIFHSRVSDTKHIIFLKFNHRFDSIPLRNFFLLKTEVGDLHCRFRIQGLDGTGLSQMYSRLPCKYQNPKTKHR